MSRCIECDTELPTEVQSCKYCGEDRFCSRCRYICEQEHELEETISEEEYHESLKVFDYEDE